MSEITNGALIIPHSGAPRPVILDLVRRTPLRLSDGPYDFPEPPDLFRLTGVPAQLGFLCDHLQSLCNLWDRPARFFLEIYFRFIDALIAANEAELGAQSGRSGGLFAPADWSFAALRPLPQARLGDGIRVDVAFWTGEALIALELVGSATPRRQRRDALARLAAAGVAVLEIPVADLQRHGESFLAQRLPAAFHDFWRAEILPASPFGPDTLATIQRAGSGAAQSSASIT